MLDYMEEVGYEWVGTAGIDDLFVRPDKLHVVDDLKLYIRQSRKPAYYNDRDKIGLRYGRDGPPDTALYGTGLPGVHTEL